MFLSTFHWNRLNMFCLYSMVASQLSMLDYGSEWMRLICMLKMKNTKKNHGELNRQVVAKPVLHIVSHPPT